jgi:hypothetical protein
MPTAPDRQGHPLGPGQLHGADHVGHARAADNERGTAIVCGVPDRARLVVAGVAGPVH